MEMKENRDLFTPEMRERVEAFYEQVEIDLFESERESHMELCRQLSAAAVARNDYPAARRAERRFVRWDEEHTRAFMSELTAHGTGKAAKHG